LSPAIWIPFTHWTSKKTTWIVGCLISTIGLVTIYVAEIRAIVPLVIVLFFTGCGIHAFLMTFYAMVADAADYGEWKSGKRIEAPLFGFVSLANKTSLALGAWIFAIMLEDIGFVANVEQSAETISGMRWIMTIAPLGGFLASAAVIAFFPFDTKQHKAIVSELQGRKRTTEEQEN
jgi:GPH family glycoside/pentoside/hexuronide:cation symporter